MPSTEDLLRRAVLNARDHRLPVGKRHPRWAAVMGTFTISSENARELCRKFRVDPDEQVFR